MRGGSRKSPGETMKFDVIESDSNRVSGRVQWAEPCNAQYPNCAEVRIAAMLACSERSRTMARRLGWVQRVSLATGLQADFLPCIVACENNVWGYALYYPLIMRCVLLHLAVA